MADRRVVGDERDASFILKEFLQLEQHEVRFAVGGKRGLALSPLRRPTGPTVPREVSAPVILDVEMASLRDTMAHVMVVREVGLEEVPIIFCSGVSNLPGVGTHR